MRAARRFDIRPMRFCMITTFYPPYSFGGDAVYVHSLSNLLAKRGNQVDVIHCLDSYRALGGTQPAAETVSEPSITVHRLSSPFGWLSPLATQQTGHPLFKSAEIERVLSTNDFDVIHFHNISLVGGPALLHFGKALKLYTIHEHWLVCPMHTLFRNNREPCHEKRCIQCALHYHRPPQLWRYTNLLREAVGQVDAFLAPTEFTRSLHMASGLPMRIITVPGFHDIVPDQDLTPEVYGTPLQRPFFLYAGRLEKLKGVHTLIPAFRSYSSADLVIAGDGNEAASLREAARDCPNIIFLGHVLRAHLSNLYSRATAVLVPSLGTEVFPLVMLEAFAARTPVIARDHGPLPEIVRESGGGLLYRNESDLPGLLQWMQDHPQERNRMAESGYRAWQSKWTPDVHLERYFSVIADLASSK